MRILAERMKMQWEHIVPLSRQALEILRELRATNGHRRYVFMNTANHDKPISENTMLYALYRMGYHSRATGHGFRATASTILNEQGWRPDVIERQLAHIERNKVRAAYNRSEYLAERRQMMQHWADYLESLSGNAVRARRQRNEAGKSPSLRSDRLNISTGWPACGALHSFTFPLPERTSSLQHRNRPRLI